MEGYGILISFFSLSGEVLPYGWIPLKKSSINNIRKTSSVSLSLSSWWSPSAQQCAKERREADGKYNHGWPSAKTLRHRLMPRKSILHEYCLVYRKPFPGLCQGYREEQSRLLTRVPPRELNAHQPYPTLIPYINLTPTRLAREQPIVFNIAIVDSHMSSRFLFWNISCKSGKTEF